MYFEYSLVLIGGAIGNWTDEAYMTVIFNPFNNCERNLL
jgi:lipoprotein signal peptidase